MYDPVSAIVENPKLISCQYYRINGPATFPFFSIKDTLMTALDFKKRYASKSGINFALNWCLAVIGVDRIIYISVFLY